MYRPVILIPATPRPALLGALALTLLPFAPPALVAQTDSIRRRVILDPAIAVREVQIVDRGQARISIDQARSQLRSGAITASDSLYLQTLRYASDPADFQSFLRQLPPPAEPVPYTISEEFQVLPGTLGPDDGIAEGAFSDGSLVSPVYHWSQEWIVDAGGRAGSVAIRHQATLADHRGVGQGFEATLYTWAVDVADSTRQLELDPPLRVQAVVDGGLANPASIDISHTRVPLTEIRISDENPGDSIVVHLIPDNGTRRSAAIRLRPTVVVTGPDSPLQGLGVESTAITLSMAGATDDEPVTVSLTSSSAVVSPPTVEVARNAPASATVRTKGFGAASFTVGWGNNQVRYPVEVEFPWMFLLFSLVGAIAGAFVLWLREPGKGMRAAGVAIVLGTVVPALYFVLGVNITWLPLPSEPVLTYLTPALIAFVSAAGIKAGVDRLGDFGKDSSQPAPTGGG